MAAAAAVVVVVVVKAKAGENRKHIPKRYRKKDLIFFQSAKTC